MPYINLGKRTNRYTKHTDNSKVYNYRWSKLRKAYLMQHPLCQKCLAEGRVTPATEIHHIKPISTGKDELEKVSIMLNPNNLMALCTKCHHDIHNDMRKGRRN